MLLEYRSDAFPCKENRTANTLDICFFFPLSFQLCQRVSAKSVPIQVTAHSSTEKEQNKNPGEFITMEQPRLQ